MINFIDSFEDGNLLGASFPRQETWGSWKTAVKAAHGLPMEPQEVGLFTKCTGRENPPDRPAKEVYFVVGRRGGKGRITAAMGVFLASFLDYSKILAPGEEGLLPIIASDRDQSRIVLNYARDIFLKSPILKQMVVADDLTWEIRLNNRITIRVMTASKAAVRGYTLIGAILEETAFWRDAGANPDVEIVRALRPGRLTTKGPLIVISTPYRRAGVLWSAYQKHWGKDGPVLVWVADSQTMNPTLDAAEIEEEMKADPEAGAAEYLAQFRSDLEDFLPLEAIEAVVVPGRFELPPLFASNISLNYTAFCDMSGGRSDAAALGIAHREGDKAVVDVARRWPAPHDPAQVVLEMAGIIKSYGIRRVTGDRYAGSWPEQEFLKSEIAYEASTKDKSRIYLDFLPLVMSGNVELLDNQTLFNELRSLERRTRSGGHDSIDHPPRGSDDLANAVCGCCTMAGKAVRQAWVMDRGGGADSVLGRRMKLAEKIINPGGDGPGFGGGGGGW